MKNVKQHIGKQLWYLLENNLKYIVESNTAKKLCSHVRDKTYYKIKDEISNAGIKAVNI
jgi:uncharacterized protein YajQ (UPF0234 family)